MDYPGIAHVFDAGATETGRPFFVMEYVRGIPIDDYCDLHKLSMRERLDLFIEPDFVSLRGNVRFETLAAGSKKRFEIE